MKGEMEAAGGVFRVDYVLALGHPMVAFSFLGPYRLPAERDFVRFENLAIAPQRHGSCRLLNYDPVCLLCRRLRDFVLSPGSTHEAENEDRPDCDSQCLVPRQSHFLHPGGRSALVCVNQAESVNTRWHYHMYLQVASM